MTIFPSRPAELSAALVWAPAAGREAIVHIAVSRLAHLEVVRGLNLMRLRLGIEEFTVFPSAKSFNCLLPQKGKLKL